MRAVSEVVIVVLSGGGRLPGQGGLQLIHHVGGDCMISARWELPGDKFP